VVPQPERVNVKQRITGRVNGHNYEVVSPSGNVMKTIPLAEADSKLRAAIQRNGWEQI
jgi:hypothetical protein